MEEGEFSEVIPQQLLKLWDEWTISSTLCTPNVLSSTGTSARGWKKVNSVKHVKTLQLWRKTTKRLLLSLIPVKEKKKTRKNSRYFHDHQKKYYNPHPHEPADPQSLHHTPPSTTSQSTLLFIVIEKR